MNKILAAWEWNGPVSEPTAYGEGHINQTYAVTEQTTQKRYILQKINTDTFKDPDGLMENICGVTDFLREKAKQRGADPERATLHVALTKAGNAYFLSQAEMGYPCHEIFYGNRRGIFLPFRRIRDIKKSGHLISSNDRIFLL